MDKLTFVALINAIIDHYKREEEYAALVRELYNETPVDRAELFLEDICRALDLFEPVDIAWWLWDADGIRGNGPQANLYDFNDKPIDVSTPEKLYDHIMKNKSNEQS